MKKYKKLKLAIGALAAAALPISTTISCSKVGLRREAKTIPTIDDDFIKTQFYKKGSTITRYAPSDNNKIYDFLINKRAFGQGNGKGVGLSGLWNNVTTTSYPFGTIFDSVGYNFGFLQNGKLMLAAYYHKYPITNPSDIRNSLSRVGDVLQKTYDDIMKSKIEDLNLKSGEASDIKKALNDLTLDKYLDSKPAELAKLDFLGIGPLAKVFRKDEFVKAKNDSDEAHDKKEVIAFIGEWFSEFSYNLQLDAKTNYTVKENEELAYAWEEVFGYTWDLASSSIGDRRSAAATLIKPWMHIPSASDHNNYLGNYYTDGNESSHKNLLMLTPSAKGKNPYGNQLHRFSGLNFSKFSATMAESLNEIQAKGIYTVDKGAPRYDANGKILDGSKPTIRKLKFGLFSKIKFNINDNGSKSVEVFDSDDDDINNKKSINGKYLKTLLNSGNVRGFTFEIKPDIKWIDAKGNKTSHDITAEDFWYAIQQFNYRATGIRNSKEATGGEQLEPSDKSSDQLGRDSIAKKIEDSFLNKINNRDNSYKAPSKQEASVNKFYDKFFSTSYGMKPIEDTTSGRSNFSKKDKEFTMELKSESKSKSANLFWHDFITAPGALNLIAIPSQKIQSQISSYRKILGEDDYQKARNKPILKYGVYYKNMAESLNDFEFAGRYYPSINKEDSIMYKRNSNFGENGGHVDSMTYRYLAQEGTWYIGYKQAYEKEDIFSADISIPEFSSWEKDIYKELNDIKDPNKKAQKQKKIGLTYIKGATSQGDVGQRGYTLALPLDTTDAEEGNYYFNDNFAKIMYGSTIKELYEAPNIEKLAETLYHGTGLELRSSLQTGINGFGIIHDLVEGKQQSNSVFGPEALIPGKDDKDVIPGTQNFKNKLTVYDSKIFNRAAFGTNFVQITKEDYRKAAERSGSEAFLVKETQMKKIQENIKHAIKKAGLKEGDKLISEQFLNYRNDLTDLTMATYLSNMQNAYYTLNKQVNFIANANPSQLIKKT